MEIAKVANTVFPASEGVLFLYALKISRLIENRKKISEKLGKLTLFIKFAL